MVSSSLLYLLALAVLAVQVPVIQAGPPNLLPSTVPYMTDILSGRCQGKAAGGAVRGAPKRFLAATCNAQCRCPGSECANARRLLAVGNPQGRAAVAKHCPLPKQTGARPGANTQALGSGQRPVAGTQGQPMGAGQRPGAGTQGQAVRPGTVGAAQVRTN